MLEIEGVHTACKLAHIYHARTYTQEKDTVLFVLRGELGGDHIQRCLGDSVEGRQVQFHAPHYIEIRQTARNSYDLLVFSFQDLWHEEVVKMNVTDDVGLVELHVLLLELLGVLSSMWNDISVSPTRPYIRAQTYRTPMGLYASHFEAMPALAIR